MAEKETKNKPKDLVEAVPEEIEKLEKEIEVTAPVTAPVVEQAKARPYDRREMQRESAESIVARWNPKTALGRDVKAKKRTSFDEIVSNGKKMLEPEIMDALLHLDTDLLLIGQAKGKFGGGKRRAWRQTQKKTMEGNVVTFSAMAIVGIGLGKAKETLPARDKATRQAKLNIIKVTRGFETPEPGSTDPHTVPFIVSGKCGSVRIKLIPAPRGTGLVIGDEAKKILRLAGIKDVYSMAHGQVRTTFNMAKALMDALDKTNRMKL